MGFFSRINEYTRVQNNSYTTIDHIFINNGDVTNIESIILESYITDHYSILLIADKQNIKNNQKVKNIKMNINIKLLNSLLINEKWETILNKSDLDICAFKFHNLLNNYIINSSKQKEKNTSSNKRKIKLCITDGLIKSIRKRDKLGKSIKNRPNDIQFLNYYKRYKNKLCTLIRNAKNDYYRNRVMNINTGDNNNNNCASKQVWNIIGKVINKNVKSSKPISQIIHENQLINVNTETNKCVNILNKYFASVGEKIAGQIQCDNDIPNIINSTTNNTENSFTNVNLHYLNFTEKDILLIIKTLKKGTSPGFDNISSNTILQIADHIISPITYLINLSFSKGVFPQIYKKLVIISIYKTGDVRELQNYRPISLVSAIAKVIEKCAKLQLHRLITDKNALSVNQYGFRDNVGCQDAIVSLSNLIYKSLDRGKTCLCIYLDIAKAFDSISHVLLLCKLKIIIGNNNFWYWFKFYLLNRPKTTAINGIISDSCTAKFGVPQGTV